MGGCHPLFLLGRPEEGNRGALASLLPARYRQEEHTSNTILVTHYSTSNTTVLVTHRKGDNTMGKKNTPVTIYIVLVTHSNGDNTPVPHSRAVVIQ